MRLHQLESWLTGPRVLDFGAGDGMLAERLARCGYQIALTDVLDYRNVNARSLPFVPMTSTGIVPFAERSFDTALALLTLHHIDSGDLSPVLRQLRRVA
jgi:2-polyprenyl-3-methyl-5-hydroxy-6-metoxy-1,4-benzoquinol methylase